jgi:hypothetical protein
MGGSLYSNFGPLANRRTLPNLGAACHTSAVEGRMRTASGVLLVVALGVWALPARANLTTRRSVGVQRTDFSELLSTYKGRLETFHQFAFKVAKGQCYAVAMELDRNDYAVNACTRDGPTATLKEPGERHPKTFDFQGFEQNAFTSCPVKATGKAVLTLRFRCRKRSKARGSLRMELYGRTAATHPASARATQTGVQAMVSACEACKEQLTRSHARGIPTVKCDEDFSSCVTAITVAGHNLKVTDCE